MTTLIDSSVLIDLLGEDTPWAEWSENQLIAARLRGPLAINLMIYAEVARDFADQVLFEAFLRSCAVEIDPMDNEIAFLAAQAHRRYRAAGGPRQATLPDFLIGAHASVRAAPLLTRDPKRIRQHFPHVELIAPA